MCLSPAEYSRYSRVLLEWSNTAETCAGWMACLAAAAPTPTPLLQAPPQQFLQPGQLPLPGAGGLYAPAAAAEAVFWTRR